MATNGYSAAGQALGFGRTGVASVDADNPGGAGDLLRNQVTDETDEEKLRRKLGLSVTQSAGALSGLAGASPAGKALFGSMAR
jgi:hypothetical protein